MGASFLVSCTIKIFGNYLVSHAQIELVMRIAPLFFFSSFIFDCFCVSILSFIFGCIYMGRFVYYYDQCDHGHLRSLL